jgi:hypothetical protein
MKDKASRMEVLYNRAKDVPIELEPRRYAINAKRARAQTEALEQASR